MVRKLVAHHAASLFGSVWVNHILDLGVIVLRSIWEGLDVNSATLADFDVWNSVFFNSHQRHKCLTCTHSGFKRMCARKLCNPFLNKSL